MAAPLRAPVVASPVVAGARVWGDRGLAAVDQGDAAAAWLKAALGVEEDVRLVRMPDGAVRACDRAYAPRGSQTAYSDGFPLLLIGEPSLAELNARAAARRAPRAPAPLPMNRFRPNLVVAGDELAPFAEDGWGALALGGGRVALRVVKPCARCKIPTIDQETATPDAGSAAPTTDGDDEGGGPAAAAEPTATLKTFRTGAALALADKSWAIFRKQPDDVFFGENVTFTPSSAGGRIACGDVITAMPRARLLGLF